MYDSEHSPGFGVPPVPKNPYAASTPDSYRRPSADDYRRPSGDDYRRPSGDDYRRPSGDDMRRTPEEPTRQPSGDDTASLGGVSLYGRRPSNASPPNAFARRPSEREREANAGTATAAIIIPAKSTMTTEDIQTPFAGDRNSTASSTHQEGADSEDEGDGTEDGKRALPVTVRG